MLTELLPSYFFDLSLYQHAAIFDPKSHVWKALEQIDDYFDSLSLGNIEVDIPDGVFLKDREKIFIGKGTVIEPGAYIKGPCYIGNHCTIRHGAYIRGNLITGNRCVIGHDTEVKNCILLDDVHAAHFAYVADSILGNRVNLGAGAKCANLKLDNTHVVIRHGSEIFKTSLRKLGAIMGDDCQIGCNSVTNPGSLLGKRVLCYPVLSIKGFIPSHSLIRSNTQLSIDRLI